MEWSSDMDDALRAAALAERLDWDLVASNLA